MNTSEPKNGYLLNCLPFNRIYIAVYSTKWIGVAPELLLAG